jgi:hypothetical protein
MSVDKEDYLKTVQLLISMTMSNFNALSVLLIRMTKSDLLTKADIDLIESASRVPLDHEGLAASEAIAELNKQRDEVFTALRKRVER